MLSCGAWICPGETPAHFQVRQSIYALCERGDPAYPAVLAAFIEAKGRAAAARGQAAAQAMDASDAWLAQN